MKTKKFYVTYKIVPTIFAMAVGIQTEYHAVECESESEAYEVASDVNSLDGISYLRVNKCGRINKQSKVITADEYWKKHYNS